MSAKQFIPIIGISLLCITGLFMFVRRTNSNTVFASSNDMIMKFQANMNADKYKNMNDAVNARKRVQTMHSLSSDTESIIGNIALVGKSYSWTIDGKNNMVALIIGNHNEQDYEIPLLRLPITVRVFTLVTSNKAISTAIPLHGNTWEHVLLKDSSTTTIIASIDNLVKEKNISIDTILMDLSDNNWTVIKEVIPRFCLMVRQYVIHTSTIVSPEFSNIRKMKEIFRESGYTYSRIGKDPSSRVFMKE